MVGMARRDNIRFAASATGIQFVRHTRIVGGFLKRLRNSQADAPIQTTAMIVSHSGPRNRISHPTAAWRIETFSCQALSSVVEAIAASASHPPPKTSERTGPRIAVHFDACSFVTSLSGAT